VVAQLVEHELPKLGVAGSNPVRRSRFLLWESLPKNFGAWPQTPPRTSSAGPQARGRARKMLERVCLPELCARSTTGATCSLEKVVADDDTGSIGRVLHRRCRVRYAPRFLFEVRRPGHDVTGTEIPRVGASPAVRRSPFGNGSMAALGAGARKGPVPPRISYKLGRALPDRALASRRSREARQRWMANGDVPVSRSTLRGAHVEST
jgi:hypothetical protein